MNSRRYNFTHRCIKIVLYSIRFSRFSVAPRSSRVDINPNQMNLFSQFFMWFFKILPSYEGNQQQNSVYDSVRRSFFSLKIFRSILCLVMLCLKNWNAQFCLKKFKTGTMIIQQKIIILTFQNNVFFFDPFYV